MRGVVFYEAERVARHEGHDCVAVYGVCPCPDATMLNQVWITYRESGINEGGSIVMRWRVKCGLCGAFLEHPLDREAA